MYCGDARTLLKRVEPNSVALSFWSPPYFVGKSYETALTFEGWQDLLREVISLHFPIIKPGGFLVINSADILAFSDPRMPRIQADNISTRKSPVTREQVLAAKEAHPDFNRHQLAALLGCSEQTIQRRAENNNVRGGKYKPQTRVQLVGGLIDKWATDAGFFLYDRRAWVKDPCWANSRWHSLSYRSVDEFEYLYVFWKPGITVVDRKRLAKEEWSEGGSRGTWHFQSVRSHVTHEAEFPVELPRRVIKLLSAPNDLVLDCFIGSGTSAEAAIWEGRKYIGFDLVPEYVAQAQRRCFQAQLEIPA
ncbi:MAG: site-specific DNA-methyltransferase [SAR202 cluster bacterium Io17-Chloro-G2]|nr:MAG: site-specific DNA-methyltransferase [SAR202 cluster bacterium Io17-Chloro-G2]